MTIKIIATFVTAPNAMSDVVEHLVAFDDLPLSAALLRGLAEAGFTRPSPIQARNSTWSLWHGHHRAGWSGTGKTLVFNARSRWSSLRSRHRKCLLSHRRVRSRCNHATSAESLARTCATGVPCLRGTQMKAGAHASSSHIVRHAGRLVGLLCEALVASRVRLLVLDEADKLLDEGFGALVICSRLCQSASRRSPSRPRTRRTAGALTVDECAAHGLAPAASRRSYRRPASRYRQRRRRRCGTRVHTRIGRESDPDVAIHLPA